MKNIQIIESQFLLLPDGRVLAHNLTPVLAAVLAELNPLDPQLATRADSADPAPLPAPPNSPAAPLPTAH